MFFQSSAFHRCQVNALLRTHLNPFCLRNFVIRMQKMLKDRGLPSNILKKGCINPPNVFILIFEVHSKLTIYNVNKTYCQEMTHLCLSNIVTYCVWVRNKHLMWMMYEVCTTQNSYHYRTI